MTARILFEYLANSLWQLSLLAAGTWLLIRVARPRIFAQHVLWLATLVIAVALPLRGIDFQQTRTNESQAAIRFMAGDTATPVPAHQSLSALRILTLHPTARTIDWLAALYALAIAFNLMRLMHGWMSARRLAVGSVAHPLTPREASLLQACAMRLRLPIERIPAVRFTSAMDVCPMIVGARCPVLLLPEHLRQTDDQALTAILAHELAHVRRRDYLANLAARIVSLPIAYHPATAALHRRIRQTREMICDANAAAAFNSSSTYARSLLSLAERLMHTRAHVEAVGLFDQTASTLEERIMKLTEPLTSQRLSLRAARISAGTVVLIAAAATAATFHVKPSTPPVYAAEIQQPAQVPTAVAASEPTPVPQTAPPVKPTSSANGELREMTPGQLQRADAQLAAAEEQLNKMTAHLNSLESKAAEPAPDSEARQEPVRRPDPPPGVLRMGPGVTPPVVLYAPEPQFPDEARQDKVAGNVLLSLQVDETGQPTHVRLLRGMGHGLDEAAIQAVSGYKFKPAMKDGQPVTVEINIEVNFKQF